MKKDTQILPDYVLGAVVLALTLFGVLMVYNTSVVVAYEQFGNKFWYLENQALWALIGIAGGYIVSKIDYHVWQKWSRPLFYLSVFLLILVLLPGFSSEVLGARRRLAFPVNIPILGHIGIQPSELAKFALVLFLSSWLPGQLDGKDKKRTGKKHLQTVIPFLIVLGAIVGLIMFQPDLGTSIIIGGTAMVMYFLSGISLLDIGVVSVLGVLATVFFAFSSEYRRNRILAFLNPSADSLGVSYHINQILLALGSGGWFGLGLGHSRQKFQYIPEAATDSIFAVIGEEIGFVGACLVIAAFLTILWRGYVIIKEAPDIYARLLASGIVALIGIQAFLNLTSVTGLTPLTGVPLPFVSYGGSSLTMMLISIGVLMNISRKSEKV